MCVPVCVCVCVCVHALSCIQLFATPWTVDHQTPLSMEFSRQEYWSGLLFPTAGDLPDPGIEPTPLTLAGRLLPLCYRGAPTYVCGASQVALVVKNPSTIVGDNAGSIPGLERCPGGGNGNPL